MTATEELRRLLDERGVEWTVPDESWNQSCITYWTFGGIKWVAFESENNTLWLNASSISDLAPEQAIAATLGPGTCQADEPDTWESIIADAIHASESDELGDGSYEQAVTALVARCKVLCERTREGESENAKLRELVREIWRSCPVSEDDCAKCPHRLEESDEVWCDIPILMEKLGVEVEE